MRIFAFEGTVNLNLTGEYKNAKLYCIDVVLCIRLVRIGLNLMKARFWIPIE